MTGSRAPRLARGAVAASIATFAALVSHVAAGGTMPGVVGVLVPWILAVAVSTMLAGRTLSIVRLAIAVTLSQLLFHALFVLGAPAMRSEPHSAFHVHDYSLSGAAQAGALHAGVGMWLGHVAAIVVTVAALHRGEHAVRALLRIARQSVWTLRRRVAGCVASIVLPPVMRIVADVRVFAPLSRHVEALSRRGPPIALSV